MVERCRHRGGSSGSALLPTTRSSRPSRVRSRRSPRAGIPFPRQRRGRQRRHPRRARGALRRRRLRGRLPGRPATRHPGRGPAGSWAATELVAWYNGHPDYQHLDFDLSQERVVVIGNGNVALDVARMLALTEEELAPTDTTDAAIAAIVSSGIREIVVLGRRGPVQASWTSTELGELGDLAGADVVVDPARARARSGERGGARDRSNVVRRNVEILRGFAPGSRRGSRGRSGFASAPRPSRSSGRSASRESRSRTTGSSPTSADRYAPLRPRSARCFLRSRLPQRGLSGHRNPGRAVRRALGNDPECRRARPGRERRSDPGLYCAGWIKRGPTGVIGTNKKDATETVERLLEDAREDAFPRAKGARSKSSSPIATPRSSCTRAGRRSTRSSARAASRTAARA